MLETLKTRKEELEKRGKKGFTLMEMLIVIAIIAVLIAIAIPIFTTQLEKARETTDLANIRSAYAELMAGYLTDDLTTANSSIEVPVTQTQSGWQIDNGAENTTIAEGHKGNGVSVPAKTGEGAVYTVTILLTGTADNPAGTVTVS